tara:strand:+ start:280 stop:534 length:255 start_codon:yes stop_codon:yes gene_type:complete
MDQDFLDLIYSNYTSTSEVMFPIILFLLILLIRDLSKYSKISDKINNKLKDLAENIEETGFKKKTDETAFHYIERYLSKRKPKD